MFNRGDRVTVTSDNYAETPAVAYTGRTGEVAGMTGANNDIVAVRLDGDTRSTGFGIEEVTRTR